MEGKIPEGKPGAGHKVYDGVEVDSNGRVVAYHISNTYPHQITSEPAFLIWRRSSSRCSSFGAIRSPS